MRRARAAGDRARHIPAKREFHFSIYRTAASETVMSILESPWLQIGPYFNLLNAWDDWRTSDVDYKAILPALK
jgi:DNA-binding GntR family transcriptional regulator